MVAGVSREASRDEIAESGQTGEGFRLATQSGSEACHFCERASDQRGDGIVPELEPHGDPSGDGKDVFDRTPQFDASDILVGVGTKTVGGKDVLQCRAHHQVGTPDRGSGWEAFCDFLGMVGTRKNSDGVFGKVVAQDF